MRILYALLRYRYLEMSQIHHLFFAGQSLQNAYRIIKKLHDRRLIQKSEIPRQPNLKMGAFIYLTDRGCNMLVSDSGFSAKELGYKRIVYPLESPNHAYHRKRMIDLYLNLDQALEDSPLQLRSMTMDYEKEVINGRRVSLNKLENKTGQINIIPDLIAVLHHPSKKTERVLMIEIDSAKETIGGADRLGMVPRHSLLDKYLRYEAILHDRSWQQKVSTSVKAFEVLTITETVRHIRTIQKQSQGHLQFPHLFHCATHKAIVQGNLLKDSLWYNLKAPFEARLLFHH
ncbi:MAG: hypothetical protein AAFY36_10595 [Bacteroidota bacterium]